MSEVRIKSFKRVLVANRGEIAIRVFRALNELGIPSVAIYSKEDKYAMFRTLADEAYPLNPEKGPIDAYLDIPTIIKIAKDHNIDAIHPGYGFLSENPVLVEECTKNGIVFIGPTAEQMRLMGDKITARQAAIKAGLPVTPGSPALESVEHAIEWAHKIGYPVIVKAKDGGGGKGMKTAFNDDEMREAFTMAKAEAKASFPSDVVYMEKYLQKPRHIEMQILADKYGHVVHLGERDCSIQRKNQKVIEESPSPALNQQQRREIGETVRKAIEQIGYTNAGTLEFLYEDGKFYFLEMNTRLQVEHPITEAVTGIDIVREQIRIASGAELGYTQDDVTFNGHAIECRINAENPETFTPCPGKITEWHAPGGLGVRVDSEIYSGYSIPPFYDSMIAKLIVHGKTRNAALMRLRRALEEFVIEGVQTTIPLHQEIISQAEFIDGQYNIHWLEHFMESRNK